MRNQLICITSIFVASACGAVLLAEPQASFSNQDRKWWAIQPVRDQFVPGAPSYGNPIDAFVKQKRSAAGLTGAPRAEPEEFIRRATFDLHGLPPTPEEVERFREGWAKDSDTAVAVLVENLLASPRYGERWAQHWLDVVRYAESDGYREDAFRPQAHRFRDYVIRSFNEDKPYDQFVREQLAADELAADDPDTLIATAFLRLGIYEWNQRNAEMQHDIMINEITRLTGEVFLGIGIGCAQCHDHKFDPLLQRDYYALRSFLSSTVWPTDRKLGRPDQLEAYARWEDEPAPIRAEMNALLSERRKRISDDRVKSFPANVQEMYWKAPEERTTYEQQIAYLVQRQVDRELKNIDANKTLAKDPEKLARYKELQEQLADIEKKKPDLPTAFVSVDCGPRAAVTTMGSGSKKEEVGPAFLALLDEDKPEITPRSGSTGRRSALAAWITRPVNPFTARVYVNRIWQHHFGTGLVATPNDFGMLGEPPSHPELLDWLATRFLENAWRTKPLHRFIMTSETYRQTARFEPSDSARLADPRNRLLWRFPPTRLSAEQVRDAMLSVSGELKHRERGGPSADGGAPVRSIYVKKLRNTPDPVLHSFDSPIGFDSAPERQRTTTPTQALLLSNNEWPRERARALARRVLGGREEVHPADVARAIGLAWGREASRSEIDLALEFLAEQTAERKLLKSPAPTVRFPKETGLRPISQNFSGLEVVAPARRSLWLQPGSRFERLHVREVTLDANTFTVEAVVQLDAIHKDGKVNTLVSRWNGNHSSPGWAFGVTSAKSRYEPRNLIVQLIGANPGGDLEYEVAASNLRVPLGKPVYLAAIIDLRPNGEGTVRFHLQDLSEADAKLQTATISHNIAGEIHHPKTRFLIGGRDDPQPHFWDGQVGRLAISDLPIEHSNLFLAGGRPNGRYALHLQLGAERDVDAPLPNSRWLMKPRPPGPKRNPVRDAFANFCHALLSSNEFLYLH